MRDHLNLAQLNSLPIRLVVAKTAEMDHVDAGKDASAIPKTFSVRPELRGRLVTFDGDNFVIDFKRA